MFKVRKRGTDEIVTVLDTYLANEVPITYFLVWDNNDWRWRPASNYVPPNYEGDKE